MHCNFPLFLSRSRTFRELFSVVIFMKNKNLALTNLALYGWAALEECSSTTDKAKFLI